MRNALESSLFWHLDETTLALLNYKSESANVANVGSCISEFIFAVLVLM